MAIEDTNWTAGTSPITDPAELRRVKEWLREFACDSEWWRVAWRLLRTCEANETAKTHGPKGEDKSTGASENRLRERQDNGHGNYQCQKRRADQ
jgi:hypothetical protein